jgi:hypothetical protein
LSIVALFQLLIRISFYREVSVHLGAYNTLNQFFKLDKIILDVSLNNYLIFHKIVPFSELIFLLKMTN